MHSSLLWGRNRLANAATEGGFVIFLETVDDVKVCISLSLPPKQFSGPAEIVVAQQAENTEM